MNVRITIIKIADMVRKIEKAEKQSVLVGIEKDLQNTELEYRG
jgi:hypothetical protein